MGNPKEAKDRAINPRVLTNAEFYLAMSENPDPSGLGLRPENRDFFVGQEKPYQQLRDALTQSPNGTIIVVTAPLGAGKDTLLNVVISDLISEGQLKGLDVHHTNMVYPLEGAKSLGDLDTHPSWVDKPANWSEIRPKILRVNEVSYGPFALDKQKERFRKKLTALGKFLGKEVPIMVLVGNEAVEDRELVDAVGSPHEPIYIRLDPLTPDMLKETLRRRIAHSLERSPEEIDIDSMFDPEVLFALAPNTDYPIANMRMTLSVIEGLGRKIKPTKEPFKITGDLIRRRYAADWASFFFGEGWGRDWPVEKIQQFKLWLIGHINNHGNGKVPMRAMTLAEIMKACPLGLDADKYQEKIINRLLTTALQRKGASQDHYLPSQAVFLEAAFGQLWLDPGSEEGQKELKKVGEIFYGLVHQHIVWGLDDKEYERKRNKLLRDIQHLYGWNPEFTSALIEETTIKVRQDEKEKEKEKQRVEREKKYKKQS